MSHGITQTWIGGVVLWRRTLARVGLTLEQGAVSMVTPEGRRTPRRGVKVDLEGYLVTPGLVNAHDHLEFNCFPPLAPAGPYVNVSRWFADVRSGANDETVAAVEAIPLRHRLLAGGFKNLLTGTTSVAHHNPRPAWRLRRDFPVTVPWSVGYCHSLGLEPEPTPVAPGLPWAIHAAEGTDGMAATELTRLDELGCLQPGTVLVHCLGIDPTNGPELLSDRGCGAVWCPGSNEFLYRAVAPIVELRQRVRVALGTDSTISNGYTLLDELRTAKRLVPALDHGEILQMATTAGADLFGLAPARGRITAGAVADLLAWPLDTAPVDDPLGAIFTSPLPALVVRAGVPLVADRAFRPLMEQLGHRPTPIELRGEVRYLTRRLHRQLARTVAAIDSWSPFNDQLRLR